MSKMKHLLKKLHIHNGRNPSSNPEPRSQISNELVEQRNTQVVDLGNSSSSSAAAAAAGNSMNFCMMEEEYQVQLALAISASDANEDTESVQIKAVKRMSLGCSPSPETTLVEFLSSQYWRHNVVNYDEKILDGFYDVLGVASHSALQGKILSLAELQSPSFACYSDCEVVLVNRVLDPALQMLEQRAVGLASESRYAELGLLTSCLAQKIADLVVDNMGGPVVDADVMWRRWKYGSNRLKTSVRSVVLPIGCLQVGLSRHRALLFKVLADLVNLPCRLVKGSCYTGSDDGAVNIIKIDDGSEFMIDLMGAPGALIPLEIYDNQAFHEDAISQNVRDISSTLDGTSQDLVRGVNPASSSEFNSNQTVPPNSGVGSMFGESVNTDMHLLYNGTIEGRHDDFKNMLPDVSLGFAVNPEYAQESLTSNVNGVHPTDLISISNSPDLGNPIVQSKKSPHSEESLYETGKLSFPFHAELNGHELTYPYVDSAEASQRPTDPSTPFYVANGFGCTTSVPFVPINHVKERTSEATANPFVQFDDSAKIDTAKMRSGERRCQQNIQGVGENCMPQVKGAAASCYNNRFSEMLDDVADCEIPWEDLQIGVRIGLGSYGEVYHADWNGKEVAVKKFLDQDFSGDAIEQFRCEVKIMQRLKHPNVVVFVGAVTQPPNLSILTEYLPRGSLFKLLHRVQIDEKRRLKMALDVAKGMYYLHTSNPTIVHRDLKSPNLLVDKNWVVKVCDFGLSRLKHHTFLSSKSNAGTPEWMAPEVLRNEPSNEKCDVYSFGVILWELATLRVPWSGMNPMQVVGAVGFQNRRPDIPENVDPTLTKIISDCWESDPNLRPSFAQLMTRLKGLQRLIVENV